MSAPAVASWDGAALTVEDLVAARGGATVSVVLPARDEERTVASVVASIRPLVGSLVDELVVVDSDSSDGTADAARAAGARVVHVSEVLPSIPTRPGKGEALWRGLAATRGDLVVFVDADLVDPDPRFVPRLLAPLLFAPGVELVKGTYRRPLAEGGVVRASGGGRVNALCARPLIDALFPELAWVEQPLGGEYAARRTRLETVPFAAAYGVEAGILVDTARAAGPAAVAQVDLGVREHRHRDIDALARTAREVTSVLLTRAGVPDPGGPLAPDRPPLADVRAGVVPTT